MLFLDDKSRICHKVDNKLADKAPLKYVNLTTNKGCKCLAPFGRTKTVIITTIFDR